MSFARLGVSRLASIVVTITSFALGTAWNAPPLFGGTWQRSIGWH
jgi:hypothetical protein